MLPAVFFLAWCIVLLFILLYVRLRWILWAMAAAMCICRKQSKMVTKKKKRNRAKNHSKPIKCWFLYGLHPELSLFYFHFYSHISNDISEKGRNMRSLFVHSRIAFFCMMNTTLWPTKKYAFPFEWNAHMNPNCSLIRCTHKEWHWHWHMHAMCYVHSVKIWRWLCIAHVIEDDRPPCTMHACFACLHTHKNHSSSMWIKCLFGAAFCGYFILFLFSFLRSRCNNNNNSKWITFTIQVSK